MKHRALLAFVTLSLVASIDGSQADGESAQPHSNPTLTFDGSWTEPLIGARYYHTAVQDPVRDRMVVFGGHDGWYRNDLWALSLAGSPAWAPLASAGTPPTPRFYHAAIYDPPRDRIVVFGGYDGAPRNDVWALSLAGTPTWTAVSPAGTPPSVRYGHTATYDPVRDRMVVVGGYDGSARNDVWALSLSGTPTWTKLSPVGPPPGARYLHTTIYDPVRDRMVVFGGTVNGLGRLNDVWGLSLAGTPAWSALVPTGTLPNWRYGHSAIYDPARDRMVAFGGINDSASPNEVWVLSFAGTPAWTVLATAGAPPKARSGHTAIYDTMRDRMVMFGGNDGYRSNEVWALSLAPTATWTPHVTAWRPPSSRHFHTAIHDPVRDRMVVFGGNDGSRLNDVWALSLTGTRAWTALSPAGVPPGVRYWHTAIHDPVRDRMVVFGGVDVSNEVWALSLTGTPSWTSLAPPGTQPSARYGHTAIYDPLRDRMIVFGGAGQCVGHECPYFRDLWSLSLAGTPAWTALPWAGTAPTGRSEHTAIYDAAGDRMIVYGGFDGSSILNDVWALSLAGTPTWTPLAPTGVPPDTRYGQTAIYDPVRNRMVMFGGGFGGSGDTYFNDVWALSLVGTTAWVPLAPSGAYPAGRKHHAAIYDPLRDEMLVFGGEDEGLFLRNDVWALVWADAPTPVSISLEKAVAADGVVRLSWFAPRGTGLVATVYRRLESEVWQPIAELSPDGAGWITHEDREVIAGGRYGYRLGVVEGSSEQFYGEAWVDVPIAPMLALRGAQPNPCGDELAVSFSLSNDEPAALEMFDVTGRRVFIREVGSMGAGNHLVRFGGSQRLKPGVYLLRLGQGGRFTTSRVARLK